MNNSVHFSIRVIFNIFLCAIKKMLYPKKRNKEYVPISEGKTTSFPKKDANIYMQNKKTPISFMLNRKKSRCKFILDTVLPVQNYTS